ncbi:MAG: DUF4126 domain-containing protein [Bacteroidia bacterium]
MNTTLLLSIILGLGLSAAVGFRIFVPALITSLAAHFGYIQISESMQWMSSTPAIMIFSVATLAEIFAYYIPFVDNALDAIAAPAAAICGTLLMGSTIVEMEPLVKWPISIIAGGGLATSLHGSTSVVRAKSSGLTAGMGNPVISTVEAIIAAIISVLSIIAPVLVVVFLFWIGYLVFKRRLAKKQVE